MNNREDYLLVLWEYGESIGYATEKDLSERLGTSPATISEAISRMTEEGIISKEGRFLRLTTKGSAAALPLVRIHRISEVFSYRLLEVPWEEVHASVMEMEHVFRGKMVESLHKNLGYPDSCPHGNPIDPAARLQDMEAGSAGIGKYRVARVTMEQKDLLKSIANIGAYPGTEVEVYSDGDVVIMAPNGELRLNETWSRSLRLARA